MLFVLADVLILPLSFTFGWLIGLLSLIPIIFIEASIMGRFGWAERGEALQTAAIANIVSMVVGIVLVEFFSITGYHCDTLIVDNHPQKDCYWLVSPFISIVIMYGLSVLIEAWVMLRKHKPDTWRVAALANLGSYALLAPLLLCSMFVLY
jgi:uncharacterized BrkB/YihY/UPF0761 family membrane protein